MRRLAVLRLVCRGGATYRDLCPAGWLGQDTRCVVADYDHIEAARVRSCKVRPSVLFRLLIPIYAGETRESLY